MGNVALQIGLNSSASVGLGENVYFDTMIYLTGNISYNSVTGEITFQEAGRYSINWWLAAQSSYSSNGTAFALFSSQGDEIKGNSPIKKDEVYGMGIIEVITAPVTLSLKNVSTGTVYLSAQVPLKGALAIIREDLQEGPAGPTGPAGDSGSTVPTGDTGPAGTMEESSTCFAIAQLANLLEQLIVLYPGVTTTLFLEQLATVSGVAQQVYTAVSASGPGLLMIESGGEYAYIELDKIAAVYLGDTAVYDPSITYLIPPSPLPPGCDTNIMAGIQAICPVGDTITVATAITTSGSGPVYVNEFGMLVLAETDGASPVFFPTQQIRYVVRDSAAALNKTDSPVKVRIENRLL